MPTINHFFNNFNSYAEQTLIEDLIIESIRMYGIEVCYMPRTLVNEDHLFGEDVLSSFNNAHTIEMYIKDVDGFSGDGDFLSKFGLEIRDQMTLTVAQRRFHEEITADDTTPVNETSGINRPAEGDLLMFPLNGKIFEVKFVEHEAVFYQMGSLQTYDLTVELWEYSHERLNTGVSTIDAIETKFSGDMSAYNLLDESGNSLIFEDGATMVQESYRIETTDPQANNEFFASQATGLDFVDFSESNPFGEL